MVAPGVFDVLYESQRRDLPAAGEDDALIARLDPTRCLLLMDLHWNDLFRRKLSREHRTWVKELIATRNKWAHAGLVDMADEDAWRALDTMTRLVEQMDAEATESLARDGAGALVLAGSGARPRQAGVGCDVRLLLPAEAA